MRLSACFGRLWVTFRIDKKCLCCLTQGRIAAYLGGGRTEATWSWDVRTDRFSIPYQMSTPQKQAVIVGAGGE